MKKKINKNDNIEDISNTENNDNTIHNKLFQQEYNCKCEKNTSNATILEKIFILKMGFSKIKELRSDILNIFENLDTKIVKLKNIYTDFVKKNKDQMFLFGLDSFNFQTKYIDIEINECKNKDKLLLNRLYCDYYRLLKLLQNNKYNNKDTTDYVKNETLCKYPAYNYLDIYIAYDFEHIISMFNDIITYINNLFYRYNEKQQELQKYNAYKNNGFNMNNFIFAYSYETNSLLDTINLYIHYLEFFLVIHSKYLMRFITRLKIIHAQVIHDIHFDKSSYNDEIQYKEDNIYTLVKDSFINDDNLQNNILFSKQECDYLQDVLHNDLQNNNSKNSLFTNIAVKNIVQNVISNSGSRENTRENSVKSTISSLSDNESIYKDINSSDKNIDYNSDAVIQSNSDNENIEFLVNDIVNDAVNNVVTKYENEINMRS
jgi:hypothetical protein